LHSQLHVGLSRRYLPVQFGPGQTVEFGTPVSLFATNVGGAVPGISLQQYVVSPDGKRFLMNTVIDTPLSLPIHLILNWARRPL
jgi:hypothetical protein